MTIDPESKKRVLPIIAMALFIDSMGIGIIIPVAPQLVMQLSGDRKSVV